MAIIEWVRGKITKDEKNQSRGHDKWWSALTAATDCTTCLVKEVNEHNSEMQKMSHLNYCICKEIQSWFQSSKKAASLGHDSSVLVESENLGIPAKNEIKKQVLTRKLWQNQKTWELMEKMQLKASAYMKQLNMFTVQVL